MRFRQKPWEVAEEFPEDIDRFIRVLGADNTPNQRALVACAYKSWSDDVYCASWMATSLFSDGDIRAILLRYLEADDEQPSGGQEG